MGMKIRSEESELEKQPLGVLIGIVVMWGRQDFRNVDSLMHGAAMVQPWDMFELLDELHFLGEIATERWFLQREEERRSARSTGQTQPAGGTVGGGA